MNLQTTIAIMGAMVAPLFAQGQGTHITCTTEGDLGAPVTITISGPESVLDGETELKVTAVGMLHREFRVRAVADPNPPEETVTVGMVTLLGDSSEVDPQGIHAVLKLDVLEACGVVVAVGGGELLVTDATPNGVPFSPRFELTDCRGVL